MQITAPIYRDSDENFYVTEIVLRNTLQAPQIAVNVVSYLYQFVRYSWKNEKKKELCYRRTNSPPTPLAWVFLDERCADVEESACLLICVDLRFSAAYLEKKPGDDVITAL